MQGDKPVKALDEISMRVKPGAIYGVIGLSGAGKSTLIRCVNLLERPTSGKVVVDGQKLHLLNATELRQARRQIGMIFQHFNLMANRTVYDNIALPLRLSGQKYDAICQTVLPLLELTGLSDKSTAYPSQLSGGQKQRVAIARALTSSPKVLLCDEATSALDPETTDAILSLIKDLNKRLGLTIMLITHEMDVVKTVCDHVAVLDAGRIIEENTVERFFLNPKTKMAQRFVKTAVNEKSLDEIRTSLNLTMTGEGYPVVRLTFIGHAVGKAYLTKIAREYHIDFSILQADIETVAGKALGFLTAEIQGAVEAVKAAIKALESEVKVEVIGYVS